MSFLFSVLKPGFALLCIFATLSTVIWQFHHYCKGEDETQVDYKHFNEAELDVYPSIALCVTIAIDEERLKEYGKNLTAKDYASFLLGDHWDSALLKIDYENVIKHWDDHILTYDYIKKGVDTYYQDILLYASKEIDPTSSRIMPGFEEVSFFGAKCLKIDILFEKDLSLMTFQLFFKSNIFLQGTRPQFPLGNAPAENPFLLDFFWVIPHYPKQALRYLSQGMGSWPDRGKEASKNYMMHFTVRNMEVLERRDKYRKPCDIDSPDLDGLIKNSVLTDLGCKPPYWNSSSSFPLCSNQTAMIKANHLLHKLMHSDTIRTDMLKSLPCRGLEKIQYNSVDIDFAKNLTSEMPWTNGSLGITFEFMESTYKELKHVRSMDVQALIGN